MRIPGLGAYFESAKAAEKRPRITEDWTAEEILAEIAERPIDADGRPVIFLSETTPMMLAIVKEIAAIKEWKRIPPVDKPDGASNVDER
jgi:hypothetical protein